LAKKVLPNALKRAISSYEIHVLWAEGEFLTEEGTIGPHGPTPQLFGAYSASILAPSALDPHIRVPQDKFLGMALVLRHKKHSNERTQRPSASINLFQRRLAKVFVEARY